MVRYTQHAPMEYYHIFGRGVRKQNIFLDKRDYVRFLFLILHHQSKYSYTNIGNRVTAFMKNNDYNVRQATLQKVLNGKMVDLVSFSLMPNHFHLIIQELAEGGIAKYMHKILTAYAMYFNEKYKMSGHVFQGPFGSVHINSNNQLKYASAYVHKNPMELPKWKSNYHEYEWSSLQDYYSENRWSKLLSTDIIMGQFKSGSDYLKYVKNCPAKEWELEK